MIYGECIVCGNEEELFENPYTEKEDTCSDCLKRQDEELI